MRFGTDGIRGSANDELTPDLALRLGRAAAAVLGASTFVVGRDTRRSGPMLEAALVAGLCSAGVSVELLGVVPTPAVASVAARRGVAGAMISASHNPFGDNGIKLFAPGGLKLSDEVQDRIEEFLHPRPGSDAAAATPVGSDVGTVVHGGAEDVAAYLDSVASIVEGRRLDGLSVVLDCANGSNSDHATHVFESLGATVTTLHHRPNGRNINEACGSNHPDDLVAEVVRSGADVGFAFDGDADRLVAVTDTGAVVDGDQLLALSALDLRARGRLAEDTVVVTVMSNLGFLRAMEQAGIAVRQTAVGDRYVLEELGRGGFSLGGEQSGHLIFREHSTTGDGLMCAVFMADLVVRRGESLGVLAADVMVRLPQVLRAVRLEGRPVDMTDLMERMASAVMEAKVELGDRGRVLLRPSGTEPVVRVMVEADVEAVAAEIAERLVTAVQSLT